jgi:dolichol kinase
MSAYALQARPIAVELHAILRDLDPARWREDMETALRARLQEIQVKLEELRAMNPPDEALDRLKERISELESLLASHTATLQARVVATREEWMGFRASLQPAYESLANSLAAWDIHVPALRPTNYRRNLLHAGAGVGIMFIIAAAPSIGWLRVLAGVFFVYAWSMEGLRRRNSGLNDRLMAMYGTFAHPHEWYRVNSATWYCTALLMLSLMGSQVIGALAVMVLAFGDPAAALVGRRWGRIRLLNGRSLEGSLTFVAAGWVAAFGAIVLLFGEVGVGAAALMALAGAVVGAVAELVSRKIDDNLSIPAAAGLAAWAMAALIGAPL